MKAFLVALALLMCGCKSKPSEVVVVDKALDEKRREALRDMADAIRQTDPLLPARERCKTTAELVALKRWNLNYLGLEGEKAELVGFCEALLEAPR